MPLGGSGPAATRRAVALVTQEVHVFAGPLADDLRLAAPGADDADLEAALELVGALGWARALPAGIDTIVGTGGAALTATQAQQVALARLALADPPVAVLDEATAEAGSAGARVLEAAADRVLAGRTALVVAHRLTQAPRADRVVVMDAGRIVEAGHARRARRRGRGLRRAVARLVGRPRAAQPSAASTSRATRWPLSTAPSMNDGQRRAVCAPAKCTGPSAARSADQAPWTWPGRSTVHVPRL